MNKLFVAVSLALVGCAAQSPGGGDDQPAGPDAGQTTGPDSGTTMKVCPMASSTADTGALTATKTQRCNVAGSMGTRKWYRMFVSLPGSPTDIVQLELWDGQGAFTGGTVRTGTFQISGAELDYQTCGVCIRAIGDKGTTDAKTYFATGGTVEITSVGIGGATLAAKITGATFAEVDAANKKVAGGCTSNLAGATLSGVIVDMGGTGGGGGGGGGGGAGACPTTVGD